MLIVNTDHGFLLGEHDYWGKMKMPFYNEISRLPFFMWDPRTKKKGQRCDKLVQTIDIPPTVLDFFNVTIPQDMQGHNLLKVIKNDDSIREAGLFGMFGGHINCTDGRYVYMRAPSGTNSPLYEHTLMPCHMKRTFPVDELQDIVLSEPFEFTKGCRMMKIYGYPFQHKNKELLDFSTMLYDIQNDPNQQQPIKNSEVESRMCDYMISLMKQNAAPGEQYDRLGLT